MPETVLYRSRTAPALFEDLAAPVYLRYSPRLHRVVVTVDARELQRHPAPLLRALEVVSDDLMRLYRMEETPRPAGGGMVCELHRVRRVSGGRLVAAEIADDGVIHIDVTRRGMSEDLSAGIGMAGTDVGRYLARV